MQRSHSSHSRPPVHGWLLRAAVILLLLLFFAAFLYSCSAQPQMYTSRGCVVFLPASSASRLPVLSPWV